MRILLTSLALGRGSFSSLATAVVNSGQGSGAKSPLWYCTFESLAYASKGIAEGDPKAWDHWGHRTNEDHIPISKRHTPRL